MIFKVFCLFIQSKSEDDKNEYDKNNGKIVSLSRVITEKKKTWNPRTVQR